MSKILITGGHLTPAQALIEWLQQHHPEEELVYVGREYAQQATKQQSWEREEMAQLGVKFVSFAGQKTGSFNPFTFARTIEAAREILRDENVDTVMSFGGYLGVPFALAAHKLGLTLVTHEQTRVLGRANRLISLLADATAFSYPGTKKPLYIRRPQVTGNPLRQGLWDEQAHRPEWFTPHEIKPVLYIAGGSQGAQPINQLLLPILEQLDPDYIIVHQVGRASSTRDPQAEIEDYLREHHVELHNYFCREFLSVSELAYLYPRVNFAVSRAGANTVAELAAFQIPTLFIPLPQANYREQEHNALYLVEAGGALMRLQAELTPMSLLGDIRELERRQEEFAENLGKLEMSHDAAAKLYTIIHAAMINHASKLASQTAKSRLIKVSDADDSSSADELRTPVNQAKYDPDSPAAKKTFAPPERPQVSDVINEDL